MKIGVLASYRGTMSGSKPWVDDTNDKEKCASKWEDCAANIIFRTKEEGEPCHLHVFLFLRWGFWHEFKSLDNYLKLIHRHMWLASETYLVIDRRIGKDLTDGTVKASLDEWFLEINKINITDILQTDVEGVTEPDETTLEKLKGLVSISRNRRDVLKELLTLPNVLKYEVFWTFGKLRSFLGDIGNYLTSDIIVTNAIIIDGEWKHCRSEIHHLLHEISGEKLVLCTNDIEADLERYAEANSIRLLTFSGFCDLRYFLNLYYLRQPVKPNISFADDITYS